MILIDELNRIVAVQVSNITKSNSSNIAYPKNYLTIILSTL
jgi:hypothetical protein